MPFAHLHLHSEYSMLDGANKIKDLALLLKEQFDEEDKKRQTPIPRACALTDHGNMYGAIEFYKTMKKEGIKPIIGIETYLHGGSYIEEVRPEAPKHPSNRRWHLILLAKNQKGYENLMYLSSQAALKGFYHRPRIYKDLLKEHSEGLICTSACLAGELSWHLNEEIRSNGKSNKDYGALGYEGAFKAAQWYKEVFEDDFYIELMRHGIKVQEDIEPDLIKIARELDIKLIASNDAHYTHKYQATAHRAFMAISTASHLAIKENERKERFELELDEFYVKSPQQMREIFADLPEAIENIGELTAKCDLELKLGNPTPPNFKFATDYAKVHNIELPEPGNLFSFANDDAVFEHACRKGLSERLLFIDKSKHEEYENRLVSEMNVIKSMKFSGYMLIVYDFIKAARELGACVGPGRGSAAGSLVSYSLCITDIDPLPYNLLFERFLNPERVSMPDIDIDFSNEHRGLVIDYVIKKYGKDNVAQVATFGKLLARGVIRDVARVCDMSLKDADTLSKLIPEELGISLKEAYAKEPKIAEFLKTCDENYEYQKLRFKEGQREPTKLGSMVWDYALALEGLNRNAGMHAAGIVISNEELWKKTPLFKQNKDENSPYITQYSKDYLEDVDLIKFDFLGLRTLDVIDKARAIIKQQKGIDINWQEIDMSDKLVYELIQSGNTLGLFQIESSGMQSLNARLKPTCFEDLIAVLALFRPGPLDSGMVDDFIEVKNGKKKAKYLFKELEPILKSTYGVIVYQEQVMQIVQLIGGFSLGGADLVRRAMGKKKLDEMLALKNEYLEGAKKGGFELKKADELWELILKFAEYGFNKSHSAAYAMISFQTAYLKTYYAAEFMAALLSVESGKLERVAIYKDEIDRLGIKLLPPCVNNSLLDFCVQKDEKGTELILYGLGAIKGLGEAAINGLIEARGEGGFLNLEDFINKADSSSFNKRGLEALAKAGALTCLGHSRAAILKNLDLISESIRTAKENRESIAGSLFADDEDAKILKVEVPNCPELEQMSLLAHEKEILGLYVSAHPLDVYKELCDELSYTKSIDFAQLRDGNYEIITIGRVEELKELTSKAGNSYAKLRILDFYFPYEAIVFDKHLSDLKEVLLASGDEPVLAFSFGCKKDSEDFSLFLNEALPIKDAKKLKRYKKCAAEQKAANATSNANAANTSNNAAASLEERVLELDLRNLSLRELELIYKLSLQQKHEVPVLLRIKGLGDAQGLQNAQNDQSPHGSQGFKEPSTAFTDFRGNVSLEVAQRLQELAV